MKNGTLLVSLQGLNRGQTVVITNNIQRGDVICDIKADGDKNEYKVPIKYIKLPGEDIDYPRCQEIYQLWGLNR